MKIIKSVPFFLYILILYNVLAFTTPSPEGETIFSAVLFEFRLISGAVIAINVATLLIIIGLHALYFEMLRSIRATAATIINHTLSLIVFIIYLVEFIVVKNMGEISFLILTFMSLLDVITGFTVTIASARRDVVVER